MAKNKYIPKILVADDEKDFREMLNTSLVAEGYRVVTAEDGAEAINLVQSQPFDLVLLDVRMPRVDGIEVLEFVRQHYPNTQVIMLTGVSEVNIAVRCMKMGAFHFLSKPYDFDELLSMMDRALEKRMLQIENKVMKSEMSRLVHSGQMIGQSKEFLKVLDVAGKVAPSDSTILLEGASGTGKEVFANFIHQHSPRSGQPFVALNCASIPETLIESELFGHEKGAFTDANALRQGMVEIASNGTLFLDEIGEVSLTFQPKLLRFIQTGEFRRIGSNKTLRSDVRIISATNKHLADEVKAGRFREDLWYRLNVITITIPSLEQRKEDILLLADNIIKHKTMFRSKKQLQPDAAEALLMYPWPGNIRELENVLERAILLSRDEYIRKGDLALPFIYNDDHLPPDRKSDSIGAAISLDEVERLHITRVLENAQWNKNQAADILGISLKTLYTKIRQFNLTDRSAH